MALDSFLESWDLSHLHLSFKQVCGFYWCWDGYESDRSICSTFALSQAIRACPRMHWQRYVPWVSYHGKYPWFVGLIQPFWCWGVLFSFFLLKLIFSYRTSRFRFPSPIRPWYPNNLISKVHLVLVVICRLIYREFGSPVMPTLSSGGMPL